MLLSFVLILAILCYLLLAPLYLEIDSSQNLYQVRFHGLASARVLFINESLFLRLKILAWSKMIDLLEPRQRATNTGTTLKKEEKQRPMLPFNSLLVAARSFKLNRFHLSLDTGDMAFNGILYPGLYALGRWSKQDIGINFLNNNLIILQVENSAFRLLRAYLLSGVRRQTSKHKLV